MKTSFFSTIGAIPAVRFLLLFAVFGIGATGAWAQKPGESSTTVQNKDGGTTVKNSDGSTTTTYPNGNTMTRSSDNSSETWRDPKGNELETKDKDSEGNVLEHYLYVRRKDGTLVSKTFRFYKANGQMYREEKYSYDDKGSLTQEVIIRYKDGKEVDREVKKPEAKKDESDKGKDTGRDTLKDAAKGAGENAAKDAAKTGGRSPEGGGGSCPSHTPEKNPPTQTKSTGTWEWIDVKTGKKVNTWPWGCDPPLDGKTAFNPKTGQNFARDDHGNWIDVKTGKKVNTWPWGCDPPLDGKTAFNPKTGQNFAREYITAPNDSAKDIGKDTAKDAAKDTGKDAAKEAAKTGGRPPEGGGGASTGGSCPHPSCGGR